MMFDINDCSFMMQQFVYYQTKAFYSISSNREHASTTLAAHVKVINCTNLWNTLNSTTLKLAESSLPKNLFLLNMHTLLFSCAYDDAAIRHCENTLQRDNEILIKNSSSGGESVVK
jgi:hypothetical protein